MFLRYYGDNKTLIIIVNYLVIINVGCKEYYLIFLTKGCICNLRRHNKYERKIDFSFLELYRAMIIKYFSLKF